MATDSSKPIRRGLVIQGGGAKGAFALGCMKALRENHIEFSAVAGTSAGALCAIIWSTDRLDDGIDAWKKIDHAGFFGKNPEGCLRRLIKVVCVAGKLFAGYVKNIDPEGQDQFQRDVAFSLIVGAFAWLLLLGLLPLWGWLIAALIIPVIAWFAFWNELPVVGWDNRIRELIVNSLKFIATTRLLVSGTWLLLKSFGFVTMEVNITLTELVSTGAVLAMMRLPIEIQTTLMEGDLLAAYIGDFLSSGLRLPTYATIAVERQSSPRFLIPGPGVFKAYYVALHDAPDNLRVAYAYASAALPFGILPHVAIGDKIFVDGGVADNTPVLPMIMEDVDEIWIISLQTEPIDIQGHLRNVLFQTLIADGPSMPDEAFSLYEQMLKRKKIITLAPRVSLGGLLTGTLNFSVRRTSACLRHGHRVATAALRQVNAGNEATPRVYDPHWKFLTRLRLRTRALPPCRLASIFARSDAKPGWLSDFHRPDNVRPAPGQEASEAWTWSVLMVWALFITDAIGTEHSLKRIIWATVIGCVTMTFPTWWARMKRNVGIEG